MMRIRYAAAEERHVNKGKLLERDDIYQSFWIFLIGSVTGFLVETVWCVYRHGRIEGRSSMVLGPFTVIYGIGALILYIGLSKIDGKKLPRVFLFGALAGTAVEFFASFFQEAVVGSVSWDYSSKPLNIGGRVCLLYSVYWGLLAILWYKAIQPLFVKMIARIPKRFYRPLTIGLAVFLAVNIVISLAAVYRWGTRMDGVPPSGLITTVLDSLFPDDFMQAVYSNMLW